MTKSEITGSATVLRDGRVAGTFQTAAMSKQAIIHMIVGEHVDLETMRPPAKALGDRVAVIDSLKGGTIRNFSAEFSRGEVVGLTGLIGSGYDEIVYMAFGAVPAAAGTLALGDRTFELPELTPPDAIEGGCILIPGDRQGAGAVVTLSVSDNVNLGVLGEISRAWALANSKLTQNAIPLRVLDIRPRDPFAAVRRALRWQPAKALLAKWLQSLRPCCSMSRRRSCRRPRPGLLRDRRGGGKGNRACASSTMNSSPQSDRVRCLGAAWWSMRSKATGSPSRRREACYRTADRRPSMSK